MKKSENINELAKSLSEAQVDLKNPTKNKTVKVKTKSGGEYTYKYAELSSILDEVKTVLKKNGLSIIQGNRPSENGIIIQTLLTHSSGQWIESELELNYDSKGNMNSAQEMGSAISYGRRYALSAILNISADDDDDANSVYNNTQTTKKSSSHRTVAPVSKLTGDCEIHGKGVLKEYAKKSGNGTFFGHLVNGKWCFGHE